MSLMERLRNNKPLSYAASAIMIIAAVGVMTWTNWPEHQPSGERAYFTVDDGKTWYPDSNELIPPYTKDGKAAVRAFVYSYAGGSKQFCAYVMRFGPSVKEDLDAAIAAGAKANPPVKAHSIAYGVDFGGRTEVKAPGKGDWVSSKSPEGAAVLGFRAPDGSELDQVTP